MAGTSINTRWQDITAFLIRLLFLFGIALTIYLWRDQLELLDANFDDIFIVVGVGVAGALIFIASAFIRVAEFSKAYIFIALDAILCGGLLYTALNTDFTAGIVEVDLIFIPVIIGFLSLTGFLYLGPYLGLGNLVGIYALAAGAILVIYGAEQIDAIAEPFTIPVAVAVLFTLGGGVWTFAKHRFGDGVALELNRLVETRARQIEDMQERSRIISEMTTTLTSTLSFGKILETALNIGRLSLRNTADKHTIGIVMLFRHDNMLYFADSRGLIGTDDSRVIAGTEGIVGQTLTECIPIIGKDPAKDPELGPLGGFSTMRSILCIPLRAHYDNYGVLIFCSEERDAFDHDHIDTLNSIGVQATVALQNAVLYTSLLEEKERLIQMEEDARKALVRDLHDIPTQTVSAVAMRIRIIMRLLERNPEQVMDELKTVEEMTLRATEEIRHVLFKLRPLALEDQGIKAALGQLAEKMRKTYKQKMEVKVGPDVEEYLDETQQGALFYLIEEACNNARKYAHADMITVQVARQKSVLYVRVADNGVGFDMEAAAKNDKGSFGMINMRERAEMLDGALSIKSAPGRGTSIIVKIPLDLQSKADDYSQARETIPSTKLAASVRERLR